LKNKWATADSPLSVDQQRALEQLLTEENLGPSSDQVIPRGGRSRAPASFGQQRLWFLQQLEPDNSLYNVPLVFRLKGHLQYWSLEAALQKIVRRHEALRTRFIGCDDDVWQIVDPSLRLSVPLVDLTHLGKSERQFEANGVVAAFVERPFDLTTGPLLRGLLLHLEQQEHVFALVLHHIICDGWSLGIFARELAVLYEASVIGDSVQLAKLPIQYADYSVWQRAWMQGEVLQRGQEFWRNALSNVPAMELPTTRSRAGLQNYAGARYDFEITPELAKMARVLSRQESATMFITLLAVFSVLLRRYTGETHVVVGTLVNGRDRLETEDLIGFFVNTLALRTDVSGNPAFQRLLQRVRDVAIEAYAHQSVPFEKVVEALQPDRQLSRMPLFQVMFVLQNLPQQDWTLSGLDLTIKKVSSQHTKFDLTLSLAENSGGGLTAEIEYRTDLFERETIKRLGNHFEMILKAAVACPDRLIEEMPMLSREEQRQVLEWNSTQCAYSENDCLHLLFDDQVRETPAAVALISDQEQIAYAELCRRANQIAQYLRRHGVEPEVRVGICLERSIDMVASLLGVLKAGGAFVPFDPEHPQERLDYMIEDTGINVLITQRSLAGLFSGFTGCLVCVESDYQALSGIEPTALNSGVVAGNAAYVIYTSGSTGRSKGVVISHDAICNQVRWMRSIFRLTCLDRVIQKASLSFDASMGEIFGALITGAPLILAKPGGQLDGDYLVTLMKEQKVTFIDLPPSLLRVLLEHREFRNIGLRWIVSGGEVLPLDLQQLCTNSVAAQLYNTYGPTETTVQSAFWACSQAETEASVPIGRPVANTEMYVLDERLQLLPVGIPGELYIGGVGLARGYSNCADLTAERFLPDHYSGREGERLYRTGDKGKWRNDGALEFLGRVDHQVKVRGFRIELGEIEVVLGGHEKIREAVVVQEEAGGEKRLVAYVVAREKEISAVELQGYMRRKLPRYMVPAAVISLPSLPLTSSGKVDRRALPKMERRGQEWEKKYVAPRTAAAELLAEIWSTVLQVERVGVEDNFFELGGHSLLAMKIVSRVEQIFHVKLPLRSLFEFPTISKMAEKIETAASPRQELAVARVERGETVPASFAQQRLFFLQQLEPSASHYNVPLRLRLIGSLNVPAFTQSVSEIVQRHEALRTRFAVMDGVPTQLIDDPPQSTVQVVDLQAIPAQQRERHLQDFAAKHARRPFDLTRGPLLRATLLRLSDQEHVFLLVIHHAVIDAWSLEVFANELEILYGCFARRHKTTLPVLAIQYADFAIWRTRSMQEPVLDDQLAYWRRQLADVPDMEIPTTLPRSSRQTHEGACYDFQFSMELVNALRDLGRRESVTLMMIVMAAFKVLLYRYSGQRDIAIGTPISGRNRAELEGLIGLFLNLIVLRTDLSGEPSFRELLRKVREVALSAYARQDVPFERLVEELQPKRDLSRAPFFQVMLVVQHSPQQHWALPGITVTAEHVRNLPAKFDLTLTLTTEGESLQGCLHYRCDLFDEPTIRRMSGHLLRLLSYANEKPETSVDNLPLLDETERSQILVEWNNTGSVIQHSQCLHQLFEEQAKRTPQRVALVHGERQLTYHELNVRANQLAHLLLQQGAQTEGLVGICLERSLELVIAVVAVLKTGAAYVPLECTRKLRQR
jgi:amino acid adenylation domain-containing protein